MTLFDPEDDPESRRAKADYETVPDRPWRDLGRSGCSSGCAGWMIACSAIAALVATVLAM